MKTCICQLLGYHIPPKRQPPEQIEWGIDWVAVPLPPLSEFLRLTTACREAYDRALPRALGLPYLPTADRSPVTRARS